MVNVINQERLEKLIVKKKKRFYFSFKKYNIEKISRKLFVSISVDVFPNEIRIGIVGLSRLLSPKWVGIFLFVEALARPKGRRRRNLSRVFLPLW